MTILKELHEIQKKLKAPKGQRNDFGKYNFRSCEDIVEAVKPLLPDGTVLLLSDDMVNIGEFNYIKASVTIKNDTDFITSTGWARESVTKKGMDDSQITGAASSYARKYALNGLFAIDDTKDSDTNENKKEAEAAAKEVEAEKQAEVDKKAHTFVDEYTKGLLDIEVRDALMSYQTVNNVKLKYIAKNYPKLHDLIEKTTKELKLD